MKTVELSRAFSRHVGKIITRFAPAPTGFLHEGHVLSALYVWGIGSLLNAEIFVRIEDHDAQRSRTEYEVSILNDLEWLGLFSDSSTKALSRQSDRRLYYESVIQALEKDYRFYDCFCSRSDLEKRNPGISGEIPYDGFCSGNSADPLSFRNNEKSSLRICLPDDTVCFYDAVFGEISENPEKRWGDVPVRDRKNNWTYQFCVSADDFDQKVNLIIRGEDLFTSTGRQVLLGRMMGRSEDAVFLHHPLILDPEGRKLGKRYGSRGIAHYRKEGMEPGDVMGKIAFEAGLSEKKMYVYPDKISDLFLPYVK